MPRYETKYATPLLYGCGCRDYMDRFSEPLIKSADAHGHKIALFTDSRTDVPEDERVRYLKARFQMMPELLEEHGSLLMLDLDCLIRRPIEIAHDIDLGIFVRRYCKSPKYKTFASAFYIHERAMPFAEALANAADRDDFIWGDDQRALWELYAQHCKRYKVQLFNRKFIDWELPTTAAIFTAKGPRKESPDYLSQLQDWRVEGRPC